MFNPLSSNSWVKTCFIGSIFRVIVLVTSGAYLLFYFRPIRYSLVYEVFYFGIRVIVLSLVVLYILGGSYERTGILFYLSSNFVRIGF